MSGDRLESGEEVHHRFRAIASGVSSDLAEAIATVGPQRFPDRSDIPLGKFLARAIVGQQLSTKAARSIWARVEAAAARAGLGIPEWFEDGREDALRACGLSRSKVIALQHVRAAHLEGRLCGQRMRALDHAGVSAELTRLWGVGQWTSDMAALFYCQCPDVWPEQDVTVRKTFGRLIGPRRKPSKWAAHFAPYRSWLALYMWAYVDARPDRDA